ncbi:MBL fold metallo-hydrolase [Deinococcus malanensis]|uniref:MBL fold metallo-hydrolase n=1 Tax=Deinococcus malanensis TaxID=1706855 RepID=UPI003624BE78
MLLDASPDLHAQLAGLPEAVVPDAVLISHAHNDHLLGLGDLLDYVHYAGGALPVYAPQDVFADIRSRFAYAFRRSAPVQVLPETGVQVAGMRVRAFQVPHGANGHSHAFHLQRPGWAAVIMTDAIDVSPEIAAGWLQKLDLLVLGTSFADESASPRSGRSVYDIREALELPWARAAGRVVLTHLSHGVDARELSLPDGWSLAYDHLRVALW